MPVYQKGNSGVWYMRFSEDGKRVNRSTRCYDKEEALQVEREARKAIRQGEKPVKAESKLLTLEEAFELAWRDRFQHLAKSTQLDAERRLRPAVDFFGGGVSLQALTTEAILDWRDDLHSQGLANGTVNKYLAWLSAIFSTAHELGYVQAKPIFRYLSTKGTNRTRIFTDEEEAAIIQWFRQMGASQAENGRTRWGAFEMADLFPFLLDTGMRLNEALSITYARHVKQGFITLTGDITKTADTRSVPLTVRATRIIQKRRQRLDPPFLISPTQAAYWMRQARTVIDAEDDPGVVLHACRHTCATRMLSRGVDIRTVQGILGHSSILTTQKYLQLIPGHLEWAISTLEKEEEPHLQAVK